ncbi:methylated-DNA--[protein]-cysteine S-methyltransferase [Cumulibacter soli]|uniref:methylated-DNA--[protein]-cysteine S-methyltransferase n=1 Tax=Cumulibacter soli TaxID=2546344 RepID=UPI001067346F|nr:methylated-DNA--[protein]-cysteine S-methyltransferase [Cumulibacter soli]
MVLTHAVISSPVGDLTVVRSAVGVCGLYMQATKRPLTPERLGERDSAAADGVADQLAEYFNGERREFDVPLDLTGTPFQRRVWGALLRIPYADRVSYRQIAVELGIPNAVRALGAANGSNPVSIIVPCHRVVASNGALTGYAGGMERKKFLLDMEARVAGT